MRVLGVETRRSSSEIAAAVLAAVIIASIAEYLWFALPRPGASGRLALSMINAVSLYRLIWTGNDQRSLMLRTVAWLSPVLLVQVAFQAAVSSGVATLD